jgi:hypothetical protein
VRLQNLLPLPAAINNASDTFRMELHVCPGGSEQHQGEGKCVQIGAS